jgi:hypothetical protein
VTERVTYRVWDEEAWRRRIFYDGEQQERPICRRYTRDNAFAVAGWLTAHWEVHRTVVVEEKATGNAWTIRGGSVL